MEDKVQVSNSAQIAQNCVLGDVVWGINKYGQTIKVGDKLSCGNGFYKWYTHVQFDNDVNRWHREQDYYHSKVVGSYNIA